MELINKIDGLGVVQLNAKEAAVLERVKELAAEDRRDYSLPFDTGYEICREEFSLGCKEHTQTQEFSSAIKDLFPGFPLEGIGRSLYHVRFKEGINYHDGSTSLGASQILKIDSIPGYEKLPTIFDRYIMLQILFPPENKENRIYVTVTSSSLNPSCVEEDIFKILGEREKPKLEGMAILPSCCESRYGIAEVSYLKKVFETYKRAQELLTKPEDRIGVTADELEVLRQDSREHKNIVLRNVSRECYRDTLQKLVS